MLTIVACMNGETEHFGIYYNEALGSLLLDVSIAKP